MTLSVWRFSHLALAVSSFLFIALAALTGIVLAFEPVNENLQPQAISGLGQIPLSQTVAALQKTYDETITLEVKGQSVTADVITANGDSQKDYINPESGQYIGETQPKNSIFEWTRSLHRSLFLHGVGRFFMGLTAFLLLLIALTGSLLVIKRQRGIKRFFSRIIREDFFSFYHVFFGRLWLVPILLISLTGVFLMLEGFDAFGKPEKLEAKRLSELKTAPKIPASDFPIFQQTKLAEVQSLEFPFSPDVEDPFLLKTETGDYEINQFTGEIISFLPAPKIAFWKNLSLDVHTGRASILWAMILAIAAVNILFFIWSGFAMTLKRRKGIFRNSFKKDQAEFIVLFGSENGSTRQFAKLFHDSLIAAGQRSFLTQLNDYDDFPSATQIVVFTATYGSGDAPANAAKALKRIREIRQTNHPEFSVVAFGSQAYPDFCQFGFDVYDAFSLHSGLKSLLEIATVNDKDVSAVQSWLADFSAKTELELALDWKQLSAPKKLKTFKVVSKTEATIGQAFTICLQGKKSGFTSGDLFNIYPENDHRRRQYSIGKNGSDVQLVVKRHENGLGSEFLYQLETGQQIKAEIEKNPEFHLPKNASQALLISNGTGIAPFLGMVQENRHTTLELYCGFRDESSFGPYRQTLESAKTECKISEFHVALSREGNRKYVSDLLKENAPDLRQKLANGTVFMLCGSLAMQTDVLEILSQIASENGKTLAEYQAKGQVKMDCY